jgi:hypothetical protein
MLYSRPTPPARDTFDRQRTVCPPPASVARAGGLSMAPIPGDPMVAKLGVWAIYPDLRESAIRLGGGRTIVPVVHSITGAVDHAFSAKFLAASRQIGAYDSRHLPVGTTAIGISPVFGLLAGGTIQCRPALVEDSSDDSMRHTGL